MANERILILEDEKLIRWSIRERLATEEFDIVEAETGKKAFALLKEEDCDLILLDHRLPDTTGLEVLQRVRDEMPETSVVMMTAFGTVESAVQAMKLGAADYLTKPVNLEELVLVVRKALDATRLRREVRRLRSERKAAQGDVHIVAESRPMKEVLDLLDKIIVSEAATTILLEGESGTGKNLIAKAIHYQSQRSERPFVTITCSAITETLLLADGGTAFLDEIGEMGPALQAKMLRFLEDRTFKRVGGTVDIQVDVRVIAATNRDLEEAVREGRFREDLYYRLKIIPILLPSLRTRPEDVPILAEQWLDHFNKEFHKNTQGFTREAMDHLRRHHWPGNVRELKNLIERILILQSNEWIGLEDLPRAIREGQPAAEVRGAIPVGTMTLEEMEKEAIRQALERSESNQVRAARLLGISRDTLRYRMKKFGFAEHEEPTPASEA
jgi:DNA-binding NtrC family response regulator